MPLMGSQVSAPPSAVVKFFTAWNENDVKSLTEPIILSCHFAPKAWAASSTTITRPMASCNSLFAWNRLRLLSTTAMILS